MKKLTYWQRFQEFMGWHKPCGVTTFDGVNSHNRCMYCGENIMQDSTGAWFI